MLNKININSKRLAYRFIAILHTSPQTCWMQAQKNAQIDPSFAALYTGYEAIA